MNKKPKNKPRKNRPPYKAKNDSLDSSAPSAYPEREASDILSAKE
mgnify:CR=1 FL=1